MNFRDHEMMPICPMRVSGLSADKTGNRQCTCDVTMRRVHGTTVAVEGHTYSIFLCVCARSRVREGTHMRACVRVCVCEWV